MNNFYIAVIRSSSFSFINQPLIRYKSLSLEQAQLLFLDLYHTNLFKKIVVYDRDTDEIKALYEKREKLQPEEKARCGVNRYSDQ